jgi:hypothetical protein
MPPTALTPVSRPVGPFAPIQASVREHYYEPRRSSRLLGQELLIPPVVVLPLMAYRAIESADGWHVPGDHHDPVVLITEGAEIGLFLVVVIIGSWIWIKRVWRRLS